LSSSINIFIFKWLSCVWNNWSYISIVKLAGGAGVNPFDFWSWKFISCYTTFELWYNFTVIWIQ
jgi:hypothetical protein